MYMCCVHAVRVKCGDQGTPGRTSDPLQSTKCRTCHAKVTGRPAETKGRQGVHPTPCRAPSAAPAKQKPPARDAGAYIRPLAEHSSAAPATQKPLADRRRPRDAKAYIRPLAEHQVPHLPRKSHRQTGGDQGTPGPTSDRLQSIKRRTCHAKATGRAAETKGRQGVHPTPCAEHQVPHLPRKSHRQTGGDQGTPGRTSDPLQSTKCRTCQAKATGRPAETKGHQGVHPTPCRVPSAAPE